jgi:Arc/MetJ family transcription regulator
MKTTLNLDDELYAKASKETGVSEKTKLIHMGLQALIAEGARKRLIALGGKVEVSNIAERRKRSFS